MTFALLPTSRYSHGNPFLSTDTYFAADKANPRVLFVTFSKLACQMNTSTIILTQCTVSWGCLLGHVC